MDPEIDLAAATAAFEARAPEADSQPRDPDTGQYAPRTSDPEAPADASAEEVPAAPEQGTDEVLDFTHIDDSTLSPELLQMKRSLQADYTRKTQEAAPWRKLGSELGVENPDEFRSALEVYTRIKDPRYWPSFVSELQEYMEQYGMSPAQARQAANEQLAQIAPAEELDLDVDDDSAPIYRTVQQLQQQVTQLTSNLEQERTQRAEEAQWQALAEGMSRMESAIRSQNPEYNDTDIEAIYNMAGDDGNLFAAQQKYESIIGQRLSRYISNKTGAARGLPAPVSGTPTVTAPTGPDTSEMTSDERFNHAHRAALAHVAALEREAAS